MSVFKKTVVVIAKSPSIVQIVILGNLLISILKIFPELRQDTGELVFDIFESHCHEAIVKKRAVVSLLQPST